MTTRKVLGRGNVHKVRRPISGRARLRMLLALPAAAATAAALLAGSHLAAAETAHDGSTGPTLVHRLETCLPAGQAKPTVVLLHGAWADASSWSGEVTTLQAA